MFNLYEICGLFFLFVFIHDEQDKMRSSSEYKRCLFPYWEWYRGKTLIDNNDWPTWKKILLSFLRDGWHFWRQVQSAVVSYIFGKLTLIYMNIDPYWHTCIMATFAFGLVYGIIHEILWRITWYK